MDAHDARRALAIVPHLPDSVAKLRHRGAHASEEVLARVGQGDAARRAVEQPHPDPLLEAANHLAQRGRRNAKRSAARLKLSNSADGDERAQLAVVAAGQQGIHGAIQHI